MPEGISFDLHVLGPPPAFVLSQDQTLRQHLGPAAANRPEPSICAAGVVFPCTSAAGEPDVGAYPHPTIRNCWVGRAGQDSDEATRTGIRLLFRFQGAHRSPLPRRVANNSQKVASSLRLAFSPARSAANRRFPSAEVGCDVSEMHPLSQPPRLLATGNPAAAV